MREDVQLFASYCIREGLLTPETCRQLKEGAGRDLDLLGFGEMLLDLEITEDVDAIQRLLDDTVDNFAAGERADLNPFASPEPSAPARPTLRFRSERPEDSRTTEGDDRLPPDPETAPQPEPADKPAEVHAAKPTTPPPAASQEPATAPAPRSPQPTETTRPPPTATIASTAEPAAADFRAWPGYDDEQLKAAVIGLLRQATLDGVSDLHLSAGSRPFFRSNRAVSYAECDPLDRETARRANYALLSEAERKWVDTRQDYDFALAFDSGERYRANILVHRDGIAGTYRTVAPDIPELRDLGFSEKQETVLHQLLAYHNGLILVTGPIGSGKTTTLASLVQHMNRTRQDHIITVEEPIEIVQQSNRCNVTQRGVGHHTRTFHSALKGALRQDPDIIVIGEMRDLETIEMAISASETGHLVIGTMHTADAASTLNRILDVFPPAQQTQIRAMVAESLRGIVCQRLLPNLDGGLSLAVEILLRNTAVSSLIREGKSDGLSNIMETGTRQGMIGMDASVMQLFRDKRIDAETALATVRNRVLHREIRGEPEAGADPAPEPKKKKGLFG
ncbi:MAG: PilT/PilU family type 4a pilus ATPase [Opitutales bacterium]